jgi:hypothetical protein
LVVIFVFFRGLCASWSGQLPMLYPFRTYLYLYVRFPYLEIQIRIIKKVACGSDWIGPDHSRILRPYARAADASIYPYVWLSST